MTRSSILDSRSSILDPQSGRDGLANGLRPGALVAVSVNGGDLIEIFLAHLHFIIAERRAFVQFRIELDPFFGRRALVLGAVNVVTDDVRLGAERPEDADQTVDRSDGDRLRRRGRKRVFRLVIERRAVVALNRFAQAGRAGLKRKASHDVLIIGPELEVAVGKTRLAQRSGVDLVK